MIQQLCDTIYLYIHFGFFQFAVWKKKGSWCQKILMDMAGLLVGKHRIWFGSLSKSGELCFRKFKQVNQAIIAKLSWMRLLLTKTSLFQMLRGKYGHIARSGKGGWRERTIDMERFWKAIIIAWYVGDTNSIDMWEGLWIPWVQGFKASPNNNLDLQRSL